jgi:hypothetical protein
MAWGLTSQWIAADEAVALSPLGSSVAHLRFPAACLSLAAPQSTFRISEIILQSSARRLNISYGGYERLASIQKLLELGLLTPADKTIATTTRNSIFVDLLWREPGPFGRFAVARSTMEIQELVFHRILLLDGNSA